MSETIGRLCGELRIRLHGIDRKLEALQGDAIGISEASRHAVERQLDRVEQGIDNSRIIVAAANARVKAWLEGQRPGW
jgi:hypothetical protein